MDAQADLPLVSRYYGPLVPKDMGIQLPEFLAAAALAGLRGSIQYRVGGELVIVSVWPQGDPGNAVSRPAPDKWVQYTADDWSRDFFAPAKEALSGSAD